VRVREIDPAHAPLEDLLAVHEVEQACLPDLFPGEAGRSADEAVAYIRHAPAAHPRPRWLAELDEQVIGTAVLFVHAPSLVYGQVLVRPESRRQGAGSALLDAMGEAARSLGVRSLFGHYATNAGAAFAAHAGAIEDQRDVRSVLDLRTAALPLPVLPEGWTLRSWVGRAPDALAESLVRARDAMRDAPSPGGQEEAEGTIEELRDLEETSARRGREMRITVALNRAEEVGAFTDLRVTPPSPDAATDDTATAAWARGQGLAVAVKLESLRLLRTDHPEVERVSTMNAEDNARMREINERIGFVPTVTLTTAVLTLRE
jgi:GNAT superfamily N-acetyltransferase/RimJ/RimL family protein N-acetyltransferase